MPLVLIDLLAGRADAQLDAIADGVHSAMIETLDVPEHDRFQVITEHNSRTLRFDPHYLGGNRRQGFVLIRVHLASGRTTEAKAAFYALVAELLGENAYVRIEDVMIVLVENDREDWSFGRGIADYMVTPQEKWS
jgi:4-oxalocrotonate tautomerase